MQPHLARAAAAMAALLAGCASEPMIDGTGALTCVHVQTLTTTTTAVQIAAGMAGAVMLQPDCAMAVQAAPKTGVGL